MSLYASQQANADRLKKLSHAARARKARLSQAKVVKSDAELISEAVAAGRVRRFPPGTSGLPNPWD